MRLTNLTKNKRNSRECHNNMKRITNLQPISEIPTPKAHTPTRTSFSKLLTKTQGFYQRSPKAKTPIPQKPPNFSKKLQVAATRNYYKNLPIKPGFLFLDSLLKAPRVHISTLEINIPDSLYSTDKLYHLATNAQGRV